MHHSSNYNTKETVPLNPQHQQLHLVINCQSLNKSLNTAHNGNSVISYYPLPIMDPLAKLQKCTIFSSLDLRSGYHHIGLTPEAKPKTAFATSGTWHWNITPFSISSLPGVFCYCMSQVLSALDFCLAYLDDILVYSMSWKIVFKHLKEANLKIKLSKCQLFKEHLHYLGHFISEHCIQLLLEKVSVIEKLEVSNTEKLNHFLSKTSDYR